MTEAEQERTDKVRNEGLEQMKAATKEKESNNEEIDLEIEAPGSANKVAEEGSLTIQDDKEY